MADYFPGKRRESWIPERVSVMGSDGKLLSPTQLQLAFDKQFESLQRLSALVLGEGPGVGEIYDIAMPAGISVAIRHGLRRIPAGFQILYLDNTGTIYADPASGWGDKEVYLISTRAQNARIRLF